MRSPTIRRSVPSSSCHGRSCPSGVRTVAGRSGAITPAAWSSRNQRYRRLSVHSSACLVELPLGRRLVRRPPLLDLRRADQRAGHRDTQLPDGEAHPAEDAVDPSPDDLVPAAPLTFGEMAGMLQQVTLELTELTDRLLEEPPGVSMIPDGSTPPRLRPRNRGSYVLSAARIVARPSSVSTASR